VTGSSLFRYEGTDARIRVSWPARQLMGEERLALFMEDLKRLIANQKIRYAYIGKSYAGIYVDLYRPGGWKGEPAEEVQG